MVPRVDSLKRLVPTETDLGVWPDIGRRLLAEETTVTLQRGVVPLFELLRLCESTATRSVVNGRAQYLAAELIPVRARVGQVQVPHLINLVGRCHRMARGHRQEHEPPVLGDSLG